MILNINDIKLEKSELVLPISEQLYQISDGQFFLEYKIIDNNVAEMVRFYTGEIDNIQFLISKLNQKSWKIV